MILVCMCVKGWLTFSRTDAYIYIHTYIYIYIHIHIYIYIYIYTHTQNTCRNHRWLIDNAQALRRLEGVARVLTHLRNLVAMRAHFQQNTLDIKRRHRKRVLTRTFAAVRDKWSRRKRFAHIEETIASAQLSRTLLRLASGWRQIAANSKIIYQLEFCGTRMNVRRLVRGRLLAWRETARYEARLQQARDDLVDERLKRAKRQICEAWHGWYTYCKCLADSEKRVQGTCLKRLAQRMVKKWREISAYQRRLADTFDDLQERHFLKVVREILRLWREGALRLRYSKEVKFHLYKGYSAQLLDRVVTDWRQAALYLRSLARMRGKFRAVYVRHVRRQVYEEWHAQAVQLRCVPRKCPVVVPECTYMHLYRR
jgi:hypothetical protein